MLEVTVVGPLQIHTTTNNNHHHLSSKWCTVVRPLVAISSAAPGPIRSRCSFNSNHHRRHRMDTDRHRRTDPDNNSSSSNSSPQPAPIHRTTNRWTSLAGRYHPSTSNTGHPPVSHLASPSTPTS